jgi:hypothetical protein
MTHTTDLKPRLLARISVVIGHADPANDPRPEMDAHILPIDIEADSIDSLRIRAVRCVDRAIKAVGDPGAGVLGIAYDPHARETESA